MVKIKPILFSILISLVPTILIWLPFFLRSGSFWTIPLKKDGMATIVANYDGPLYIAVAKSFYDPTILETFNFDLKTEYYAAHFPLYPILIKPFSMIIGYPYSTLFVTVLSSIFAIYIFGKYISDFVEKKDVLWMIVIFSMFPARWLIVRSIGSPEPLFIGFIVACLYFFRKEKYLLTAIFGALAALTKSPGILIFPALLGAYFTKIWRESFNLNKGSFPKIIGFSNILPLLLIPLATVLVFYIFKIRFNDFFAYFHSGDNIHLFLPPFQIFNPDQRWVGTFWLEEIIFVFMLGAIGILNLIKKDQAGLWFSVIFFISTLFVAHRDIVRYSLPIVPFLLVGYSNFLVKKEFKYAFYLIILPIYLFSIAFISKNTMPIPDWGPLL